MSSGDDFALVVATGDTEFTVTDHAGNAFTFAPQTEYWYDDERVDLSVMSDWAEMSWRCYYSGSYETAGAAVAEALSELGKQASAHAWTASRNRYSWKAGVTPSGCVHSACFVGDSSGVVVGTDARHRLAGLVIYNNDNGATWPDSGYTTVAGAEISFEANSEEELPSYLYKFVTGSRALAYDAAVAKLDWSAYTLRTKRKLIPLSQSFCAPAKRLASRQ